MKKPKPYMDEPFDHRQSNSHCAAGMARVAKNAANAAEMAWAHAKDSDAKEAFVAAAWASKAAFEAAKEAMSFAMNAVAINKVDLATTDFDTVAKVTAYISRLPDMGKAPSDA